MTIEKKLLGTSPSGDAANVADVFSTYLWKGNGGSQTITNGIDLAGEGGMVWIKNRTSSSTHSVHDTERGVQNRLRPDTINASGNQDPYGVSAFNSNGFSYGSGGYNNNQTGQDYVSWTFRKKEKFFDIVTYTGNYVAGREISHGLAGPVGMMIIKCLNNNEDWAVYHRGANGGVTPQNFKLILNNSSAAASGYWNNTAPTDSSFTVGQAGEVNGNNQTYVAYLFADNSSEDADDQMIKCGSYTTDGSGNATIDLGWEPQFVITKKTNGTSDWNIWDTMRGWSNGSNYNYIVANTAAAETGNSNYGNPTATGFTSNGVIGANSSGIYMAIRAPMMKKPEAATDVFGMSNAMTGNPLPTFNSTFPVDMAFQKRPAYSQNVAIGSRLQGTKHLYTDTNSLEVNEVEYVWDYMDGWGGWAIDNSYYQSWNWKRAKGYMDCVAYSGDRSSGSRTVAHSLGVVPEMIWVKATSLAQNWSVYTAATGGTKYGWLNANNVFGTSAGYFNNTNPTDSVFTVGNDSATNATGYPYIAYLFATLDGISKCGSYTGNGSYQTIPCGFSAGSRFILIRRTDAAGSDWYVWDSVRGISAGNDPHLSLNTNAAQVTNDDSIDPANSGFIVNQVSATNINVSSAAYIFYAIA